MKVIGLMANLSALSEYDEVYVKTPDGQLFRIVEVEENPTWDNDICTVLHVTSLVER